MKFYPRHALICSLALLSALVGAAGCKSSNQALSPESRKALEPSLPVIPTVQVRSHPLSVTTALPGELQPYESVAIYPKVTGFVQWIGVDRGSKVHQGELLARLVAPELTSQRAEAQASLSSSESRRTEAEAKTAADSATYERLKVASQTPGVIAENELQIAQQTVAGDRARELALRQTMEAARATLQSAEQTGAYLHITAPFNGVVTARNVHPGALVGPGGGGSSQAPLLNISQISRLRLTVAVPEAAIAYISPGAEVGFTVQSFPDRKFYGKVARLAQTLDSKTRTMPVELDVDNAAGTLTPGMFADVIWPENDRIPSLFVPASAVVRSMESTFVVRVQNGETSWVNIKTGLASGDEVQVFGDLAPGQEIALRGSEELRPQTKVATHLCSDSPCSAPR